MKFSLGGVLRHTNKIVVPKYDTDLNSMAR